MKGQRARFPASARFLPQFSPVGAWLSLVEHSVRDRGVGGSNPLAPTNSDPGISSPDPLPAHSLASAPVKRTQASLGSFREARSS